MNIKQALIWSNKKLATGFFDTPQLDSEVILSHVIKKSKEYIYANPERKLTPNQLRRFKKLINQRFNKKPVAYLVGKKWFFGNEFIVNKHVLIPRPETEIICEQALEINNSNKFSRILDMGTGCGNIIISLAKNLPENIEFHASEISPIALKVACKNAKQLDCINKIKFIKSDLFKNISNKYDLIVANLPYVPNNLDINPGDPGLALFGGEIGTEMYETMFKKIQKYLKPNAYIIIEIDSPAIDQMKRIIKQNLRNTQIHTIKDLAGNDRIMVIKTT